MRARTVDGGGAPAGARSHLRQAVLETAAGVLAEDGRASIDDIAQASGVGRATLYRWFANREQLIEAILEQLLAEADEIARRTLAESELEPLALLQTMAREFLALGERYRYMEARLESDREDEQLRSLFVSFVAGAQESGRLSPELPPEWIGSMLGAVVLAAAKDIRQGRVTRLRAERLIDSTLALLLDPDGRAKRG